MLKRILKRLELITKKEKIEARELTVEEIMELKKMFPKIGEKNEKDYK